MPSTEKSVGKLDLLACMPALIGGVYLLVDASYGYFTHESVVFAQLRSLSSSNGVNWHTTYFVGAVTLLVLTMGLHLLIKLLTGKEKLLVSAVMQAYCLCVPAGIAIALEIIGPGASILTYCYLVAMTVIGVIALLYAYGVFGRFEGNILRVKHKTTIQSVRGVEQASENSPARTLVPSITFADIYGNDQIKARLKEAAQKIVTPEPRGQSSMAAAPRNGIALFGTPGNGKTVFAEALAGELKLPLLQLTHSDVASRWVGERTTYIKQAFEQAIRTAPCVLFIDEVDSFLESREGSASDGVKEDRDVVNALLTLMVDIRRHRVILMVATNHMDRLDDAGVREGRFDFKVEITPPDAAARIGLLNHGLKNHLPRVAFDADLVESVARRWNGFSVKRILAVTEELPSYLKQAGKSDVARLTFDDFMGALRAIQGRRGVVPENVKPLSELLLSSSTKDMIAQITGRLVDPEYTERNGGTLPTGVLFAGPPGTGKTATVKALANEIQWAFLPVTGADMARSPKELEKTYAKATEIRPCLIFIDEADELLKSRNYSPNTEATNKLLTLMDGVNDRVKDVVWIAATNSPEMIDPALLRGGRFTEKVMFELPTPDLIARYVEGWIAARKVKLSAELDVHSVADSLGQQSIANVEAVLQAALNRAISRREMPVAVSREDLTIALQSVVG